MPKYSVPVAITITGWVEVEAENEEKAKEHIENTNIFPEDLNDTDRAIDIFDEIERLDDVEED